MKNQAAKSLATVLMLVFGIACTQSALAQTFRQVKVKGNIPLIQVAPGGASVWALANNGHPYVYKGKQFVLANNIFLCQIAVGGGNVAQPDVVFGLDCSGNIYRATLTKTTWTFSQLPGVLDFIAIGPGYSDNCHPYEVWGLNPSAFIYRYNFCIQNWDQAPGTLGTLAVGGAGVWGLGGTEAFRFNFKTLVFDRVDQGAAGFEQIAVGPSSVWIKGSFAIDQLDDFTGRFDALGGTSLILIQAGGNGLWAIDSSQQIFRFDSSSLSLVRIPGVLASISVGSGGGVWGLNSSGKVFAFSTP